MCDRVRLTDKLTEVRLRLVRNDFCSAHEKDILLSMKRLIESLLSSDTMMKEIDSRRIKYG